MNRQQLIAELRDYRILGYEVLVKLNASTDKLQAEHDRLELEINGVKSCELTCDVIGYEEYVHGLDYDESQPEKYGEHHRYGWKGATSLIPTGVNKDLGSQCGGVTGNEVNLAGVSYLVGTLFRGVLSQSFTDIKEAYQDFNSFTANELVDEDSVILIEVIDNSEVVIDSKSKEEIQQSTSAIVATEISDNLTEFKGIPVEHYSNYDWKLKTDDLDTVTISPWLVDDEFTVTTGGQTSFTTSFSDAVGIAKNYLATEDEKIKQAIEANIPHQYAAVLGGQQQNQVTSSEPLPGSVVLSPKHYLKPKIYLFAAMTEFVFLMECLSKLLKMFADSEDKPITIKLSSSLFKLWWTACDICGIHFLCMPKVLDDNYTKLRSIHLEAKSA